MRQIETLLQEIAPSLSVETRSKLQHFATVTSTASPDAGYTVSDIKVHEDKLPEMQDFLGELYSTIDLDTSPEQADLFESLSHETRSMLPPGATANIIVDGIDLNAGKDSARKEKVVSFDQFLLLEQKKLQTKMRLSSLNPARDLEKIRQLDARINQLRSEKHSVRDFYNAIGGAGLTSPAVKEQISDLYELVGNYKADQAQAGILSRTKAKTAAAGAAIGAAAGAGGAMALKAAAFTAPFVHSHPALVIGSAAVAGAAALGKVASSGGSLFGKRSEAPSPVSVATRDSFDPSRPFAGVGE